MATNLAMPLLVYNMGGEMLYILQQRLFAQSIPPDKSDRVLQDVVSTMFAPKFVEELFRPERVYSSSITRQIFDRLAHSSIMRLNTTSMDKLFDLMTMGTKHQLMCSAHPYDMLQATLNHIDGIREMVKGSEAVTRLVNDGADRFIQTFAAYDSGQLANTRQALLRYFQDRRVKVSVFLQDGLQLPTGSIVISPEGSCPVTSEIPGTIRYVDDDGHVTQVDHIANMPNARNITAPTARVSALSPLRPCQLGRNVYIKERPKSGDGKSLLKPSDSAKGAAKAGDGKSGGKSNEGSSDPRLAKAELNAFADLVRGPRNGTSSLSASASSSSVNPEDDDGKQGTSLLEAVEAGAGGTGSFIISNLFSQGTDGDEEDVNYDPTKDILEFDLGAKRGGGKSIADDLDSAFSSGGNKSSSTSNPDNDDDDLLALMDMAAGS